MITTLVARRLMMAFGPLMGARATATVQVTAPVGTVVLPAGKWLAPVIGGSLDMRRLFFVNEETSITGTTNVAISSMTGGLDQNVPAGPWRFCEESDMPLLAPVATSLAAASGGDVGMCKQAVIYEGLSAQASRDLFLGKLSRYPSLVLAWESTGNYAKRSSTSRTCWDTWDLYVVTSRQDSTERRAAEGLAILDEAEERIVARTSYGIFPISGEPIELVGRGRRIVSSEVLIYKLTFKAMRTVTRNDDTADVPSLPWNVSNIQIAVPNGPEPQPEHKVITNIDADMRGPEYDGDEFTEEHDT